MSFGWVDWLIIGIMSLSVITGICRGFVKELIALGAWALAIWLAFTYSEQIGLRLEPYVHDKTMRTVASFVVILLVTFIAGGLVNAILSFIMRKSGLSRTDRALGMGFGLVRGVFIVSLMMLMVQLTPNINSDYRKNSRLYATFDPMVHWLSQYTPELISTVKDIDKPKEMDVILNDVKDPIEQDAVLN